MGNEEENLIGRSNQRKKSNDRKVTSRNQWSEVNAQGSLSWDRWGSLGR